MLPLLSLELGGSSFDVSIFIRLFEINKVSRRQKQTRFALYHTFPTTVPPRGNWIRKQSIPRIKETSKKIVEATNATNPVCDNVILSGFKR